jgi:hypothetical protein
MLVVVILFQMFRSAPVEDPTPYKKWRQRHFDLGIQFGDPVLDDPVGSIDEATPYLERDSKGWEGAKAPKAVAGEAKIGATIHSVDPVHSAVL